MRELRRSFGVLGEAQWFFRVWEGRGRRLVLKTASSLEQRPPQYYGGAVPQRAILLVAASCKKMEHSNLGLRQDGMSINEGKDPERVGHLEQSADQGLGRLGSHAEPGLHGRSAGTGRQGRSIGSSLSSGRTLGPLPQSKGLAPRSL